MTDEQRTLDNIDDLVDYVKSNDFYGVVTIGLHENIEGLKIFQFREADETFDSAMFLFMRTLMSAYISLTGPNNTLNVIIKSLASIKEFKPHLMAFNNKNETIQ